MSHHTWTALFPAKALNIRTHIGLPAGFIYKVSYTFKNCSYSITFSLLIYFMLCTLSKFQTLIMGLTPASSCYKKGEHVIDMLRTMNIRTNLAMP